MRRRTTRRRCRPEGELLGCKGWVARGLRAGQGFAQCPGRGWSRDGGAVVGCLDVLTCMCLCTLTCRFCLRKVGNYGAAVEDFSRLLVLGHRTVRNYNSRAYCHASLGQYADAVQDYTEALQVR